MEYNDSHIEVLTNKATYKTKKLVIAGGAWNINLFDIPKLPLSIVRQVVGWFPSKNKTLFDKNKFPVWILQKGENHGYGFPEYGNRGLKIGIFNHLYEKISPDKYNKNITLKTLNYYQILPVILKVLKKEKISVHVCLPILQIQILYLINTLQQKIV
ncbi:MAG: hypothetical protein CM1200mP33_1670 [Chloroflexota bacterium]|nr:MAG: hypothetical protein CM1200mP33_1670 [Chloroflexota bacterium]